MEYVLLVKAPSDGWVVWAFADTDEDDGFLRTLGKLFQERGCETMIYLRMGKP